MAAATFKDPSITTRAPKVTVKTVNGFSYTAWLVGNTRDGGVELERKNGQRLEIPRDAVAKVSFWKEHSA